MVATPGDIGGGPGGPTGPVIRRIAIVLAVILLPIFIGTHLAQQPVLGLALAGAFCLFVLIFLRPTWFLMLGLFFFYGALKIVDVNVFGRIVGLFYLKDLFFVVIVGYTIATEILRPEGFRLLRRSPAFVPWLLLLGWWAWQMFYTVKIMGDDPILAFRVGRHLLAYLFPVIILRWFRTERDWRELGIFIHGLAFLSVLLGVLAAMGVDVIFFSGPEEMLIRKYHEGIFKYFNPGESLVFALAGLSVWRYAYRPSKKNLCLLVLLAGGASLFLFRARLAGLGLGLFLAWLLAHEAPRRRTVAMGAVCAVLVVMSLTITGILVSQSGATQRDGRPYVSRILEYFGEAVEGLVSGESQAVQMRKHVAETRLPLVKEHPLCGIGFVSPFGKIAWRIHRYGLNPTGHVDVGWVDALMRLGGIGAAILTALLLSCIIHARRIMKTRGHSQDVYVFALTLIGYVVLMFVTTYSFSYPTREPAIMTFSILFAYLLHHGEAANATEAETEANHAA
ncbi:MAG: O-antigen ligase family protein [Lentisphaerae bacterium]|nr:O-antigen ligase family protein [Lentisphaerota bacterium]